MSHGRPDVLTIHSMGGLGNQLFIYAAGLAAARASGLPLEVDTSLHSDRDDRPFLLAALGFPISPARTPLTPRRSLRRRRNGRPPSGCSYQEAPFRYDEEALRRQPGECLFGYFQCYRYVEAVRDVLAPVFERLAEERLSAHAAVLATLADPSTIVLHVRRGDYLAPGAAEIHGVASVDYYRRAVEWLRRCGKDGEVLVFSDDVPAALEELSGLEVRAALEQPAEVVDELLLMSRAPALVTANSSFSWWAGWLGERPGRPVISPRPWFDDVSSHTRDLLPPHWLTLGRHRG